MNERNAISMSMPVAKWIWLALLSLVLTLPVRAQIVINEFLADNQTYAPFDDFPDYFPDYVELYNTSGVEIDLGLSGWRISDSSTNYTFASGVKIAAGGYLLVICDNETTFPGIHTGFGLSGTQGDVVTLSQNGFPIESRTFGIQAPDFALGRVPDGSGTLQLTVPTPGTNNVAAVLGNPLALRINEWQSLGDGRIGGGRTTNDWIEIFNTDTNPVALVGLVLTDDPGADLPDINDNDKRVADLSFIGPQGFAVFYLLPDANDADELNYFSLSSTSGDQIWLYAGDRSTQIDYVVTAVNTVVSRTEGRLPDGADFPNTNNVAFVLANASRGESNFGQIPEIVINEALAHVDPPLEDAIELHNPTTTNVNVGNWWLSNSRSNAKKYQIPAGTIIPAGGFKVLYEYQFSDPQTAAQPFNLNSAHGDEVYLFKANANGDLLGFRRGINFGASENGVSFGRWINSQTNVDIVPMAALSLGSDIDRDDLATLGNVEAFRAGGGSANRYPKVGPIVINEIHYHPPEIISGGTTNDNVFDEFVELHNFTSQTVLLYDPLNYIYMGDNYADGRTNTWRLRGEVDFDFPENTSIPAGGYVLVVNFDPADTTTLNNFINQFGITGYPGSVQIFGPYKGKLSNGGATVDLRRPDAPQGPPLHNDERGFVPYLQVDSVRYNDKVPWPVGADGDGQSLQRRVSIDYGNDPANWKGGNPTPGRANSSGSPSAPNITFDPASQTAAVGGSADLVVTASGQDLSYRWQFNGVQIDGATNATLRLANLTTNMAGQYRAVVVNPAGIDYSAIATLSVILQVIDSTLPTVAIASPANNARVTSDVLTVSGTAKDNLGVAYVEVQVNDGEFAEATGTTSWSKEVTLVPGLNTLRARSVDIATNVSAIVTRTVTYVVTDTLNLSTNGSGSVSGANSTTPLEVGRSYKLVAKPASGFVFSNWTGDVAGVSPSLTFTMEQDLDIVANFVPNPFLGVAGTFNGLFYEEPSGNGVRPESAGYFTMKLNTKGTYSAQILLAGSKHPVKGTLDLAGHGSATVTRSGQNNLTVNWSVALDGSDTIAGTISDGVWTSTIGGDRLAFHASLNPSPYAGRYTFVIPRNPGSPEAPEGDSYGSVLITTSGQATIAGSLAENIKLTQKTAVSKNGEIPLYFGPYTGRGLLTGWLGLEEMPTTDLAGEVTWMKPSTVGGTLYPAGFTNESTLSGSTYVRPATTERFLNMTDGNLTLTGGNLAESHTNSFILGLAGKITNNSPHKVTLKFIPATGLFSGTFTPTGSTAGLKFNGAILQSATNGSGYFLGTTNVGRVSIEPVP